MPKAEYALKSIIWDLKVIIFVCSSCSPVTIPLSTSKIKESSWSQRPALIKLSTLKRSRFEISQWLIPALIISHLSQCPFKRLLRHPWSLSVEGEAVLIHPTPHIMVLCGKVINWHELCFSILRMPSSIQIPLSLHRSERFQLTQEEVVGGQKTEKQ